MGILKYVAIKPKDYLENQWQTETQWQTKQNCTWERFLKNNSDIEWDIHQSADLYFANQRNCS